MIVRHISLPGSRSLVVQSQWLVPLHHEASLVHPRLAASGGAPQPPPWNGLACHAAELVEAT